MTFKKQSIRQKLSVADKIVDGLQDFAKSLKSGVPIGENYTRHKVDLKLEQRHYDAKLVSATRAILGINQVTFAQFLGVSDKLVRAWVQGANDPSGIVCRFMDEIRESPAHFKRRLRAKLVCKKGSKHNYPL